MAIELNKQYTCDGFNVQILATDIDSRYPVVGVVKLGDHNDYCRQWTADGKADYRSFVNSKYDLIEKGGEQ